MLFAAIKNEQRQTKQAKAPNNTSNKQLPPRPTPVKQTISVRMRPGSDLSFHLVKTPGKSNIFPAVKKYFKTNKGGEIFISANGSFCHSSRTRPRLKSGPLEDQVVPVLMLQEMPELQSRWSGTFDRVSPWECLFWPLKIAWSIPKLKGWTHFFKGHGDSR